MNMKRLNFEFSDFILILGLGMISYGLLLIYAPLMWLFMGTVLVLLAVAFELPTRKKRG